MAVGIVVNTETQTDLMKKGLRLATLHCLGVTARNTDRPDEEGIKTEFQVMFAKPGETQTDLMKKGLRHSLMKLARWRRRNTDRPDEEGIKTRS